MAGVHYKNRRDSEEGVAVSTNRSKSRFLGWA